MATILIVEDEPMILAIAQAEFEDAGYRVVDAADSDAALHLLRSDSAIDLLFTDVRMPGALDGWGLARAARDMLPSMPVIYATGFSHEAPQLVDGGLLFIKPYRLSEVVEAVGTMIEGAG